MPKVMCDRCQKLFENIIELVDHKRKQHMIDKEVQTHWNHTNNYWFCSDCGISYDITEKNRLDKHIYEKHYSNGAIFKESTGNCK